MLGRVHLPPTPNPSLFYFCSVSQRNLPAGDFPNVAQFCKVAKELDFSDFPKADSSKLGNGKLMRALEKAVNETLPNLLKSLPGMAQGK